MSSTVVAGVIIRIELKRCINYYNQHFQTFLIKRVKYGIRTILWHVYSLITRFNASELL